MSDQHHNEQISTQPNCAQATQRLSSAAHGSEAVVRPLQRFVVLLVRPFLAFADAFATIAGQRCEHVVLATFDRGHCSLTDHV